MSKISDYINTSRVQNKLIKDKKIWNQICSSMDVLGDTTYAISSYLKSTFPDYGLNYIYIYGILQSLFLQQDSLKHLTEALSFKYEVNVDLREIREIRNEAIGHPTNKGNGKSFHYISRMTISKEGFSLLSSFSQKDDVYQEIDLISIIEKQKLIIIKKLEVLVKMIENRELEHKKMFKETKLVDFTKGLDYLIGKIFEALYSEYSQQKEFYILNVNIVIEKYNLIKVELEKRDEFSSQFIKDELNLILYTLENIKNFFNDNNRIFTQNDTYIFISFLRTKNKEFSEVLKDIDDKYNI